METTSKTSTLKKVEFDYSAALRKLADLGCQILSKGEEMEELTEESLTNLQVNIPRTGKTPGIMQITLGKVSAEESNGTWVTSEGSGGFYGNSHKEVVGLLIRLKQFIGGKKYDLVPLHPINRPGIKNAWVKLSVSNSSPDWMDFATSFYLNDHIQLGTNLTNIYGIIRNSVGSEYLYPIEFAFNGSMEFNLQKSSAFTWEQLLPEIKQVFSDYFEGKVEFLENKAEEEVSSSEEQAKLTVWSRMLKQLRAAWQRAVRWSRQKLGLDK